MARPVQRRVPAVALAAAPCALRCSTRLLALALATDAIQRCVHPADEMEVVDHDSSPWQLVLDRMPVGVVGIDRHDPDSPPVLLWERPQIPLHDPAAAAIEHLDHAPAIKIGDDGRELVTAAMVRLIQRQPPRRR